MDTRLAPLAAVLALGLACAAATAQPVVTYVRDGVSIEQVRDDLKLAIEARGLVVDYESHVGAMLERTGKDLGTPQRLYADARVLQFCSAALSRKTMQADPANLVFCPYSIAVFATAAQPTRVVVSYRKLQRGGPSAVRAPLAEVDRLLDGIAREAVGRR